MLSKRGVFLILLLCLLSTAASAAVADSIQLTDSSGFTSGWIVANKIDNTTLTAQLYWINGTIAKSQNVPVTFTISDVTLGSLTVYNSGLTDSNGRVTAKYTANTTKGTAIITAKADNKTATYTQHIDHDTPYYATFAYNGEVIVNETTTITTTYTDYWGNLVDELREQDESKANHTAYFEISSPLGNAGFESGASFKSNITKEIDDTGVVSLACKVDTYPGDNIVYMAPVGKISAEYFTISGISQGVPFSMVLTVYPVGEGGTDPSPYVYTDGSSYFVLTYILYDAFGNPTQARNLSIDTVGGIVPESYIYPTNALGIVNLSYGPKDKISTIEITATAIDNTSVTKVTTVSFVSSEGNDIILTANPETGPSYDVMYAKGVITPTDVTAKVIDMMGNPVPNETVSFSLGTVSYDEIYNVTSDPYFVSTSAMTDSDGLATVPFMPGGFSRAKKVADYDDTATAHAIVTASWTNTSGVVISRDLVVNWMNYPYLSVTSHVEPPTVAVNDTVDVTIELRGDGFALMPDPIDTMLVIDRSGSMLYDDPDRMYSVREAAKDFVDAMTNGQDQVGLVTFGRKGKIYKAGESSFSNPNYYIDNVYITPKTYADYATVDKVLTSDLTNVRNQLDLIVPDYGTPMRYGLYKAINEIKSSTKDVKAIILLSDGDYNFYGDPLARGTKSTYSADSYGTLTTGYYGYTGLGTGTTSNQNMSNYAKNNGIKIYSIGYAEDLSSGGRTTLRILAEGTGGKYYDATAADISAIYTSIAGELKTAAGANTTMDIVATNVSVNNVGFPGACKSEDPNDPENCVFKYVPVGGISTYIQFPNGTSVTVDQSGEWASSGTLSFDIGEIKLGQIWNATFRLKVKKAGNIDLFGDDSKILFDGSEGASELGLPYTPITAMENINDTGMNATSLNVYNLGSTMEGKNVTDYLPVTWNLDYTGLDSTLTERIYYTSQDLSKNQWILFETRSISSTTSEDSAILDVRTLPYGRYYIKVYAKDGFGYWDEEITDDAVIVGSEGTAYIKLE